MFVASKGIGANLLKLGTKRRRSKTEMQQLREEEELKGQSDETKSKRIIELEKELKETKAANQSNNAASMILTDLVSKGKLRHNLDGSVDVVNQLNDFPDLPEDDDKEF